VERSAAFISTAHRMHHFYFKQLARAGIAAALCVLLASGAGAQTSSQQIYQNFFASIVPTAPGTNLLWNTNNLAVNGPLAVTLGNVNPQVGRIFLAGTNLVFDGAGGGAGCNFAVLAATNLITPLSNWMVVGFGACDRAGNFTVTNGLSPFNPQLFYAIRIP
jgi:hypothetical protein